MPPLPFLRRGGAADWSPPPPPPPLSHGEGFRAAQGSHQWPDHEADEIAIRDVVTPTGHELQRRASSLRRIQLRVRSLSGFSTLTSKEPLESRAEQHGPLGLNLLSEPAEPHVDIIFIHGLGGGSRKTWSHSTADLASFWPKQWLPSEPGFKHARIHSYGYPSDWGAPHESRLRVQDFAANLLADIYNSPHLGQDGQDSDNPIILVAHSMGGLVAKKAYLLATRDPLYKRIANRIHSLYFLGTPHRGADSAQLAKNILTFAATTGTRAIVNPLLSGGGIPGAKSYLNELIPGSGTLDGINDEFRHEHGNLNIWSFWEAVPTRMGLSQSYVVEKSSAVIGLPREHVQSLNADHRHICKFESPENPDYLTVRNCLATTIKSIDYDHHVRHHEAIKDELKLIANMLSVEPRGPDLDLSIVSEQQHPGTCTWLTEHSTFHTWSERYFADPFADHGSSSIAPDEVIVPSAVGRQARVAQGAAASTPVVPRLLWLNGRPGSGKSVACSHVVQYFEASNLDCSFYFSRYSNPAASTVAAVLRSLAYQMATSNYHVRKALVGMARDGETVHAEDHNKLWTSIFMGKIFRSPNSASTTSSQSLSLFRPSSALSLSSSSSSCLSAPHFWVLDALDECTNKGAKRLLQMLSKIPPDVPLQVLISSRPGEQFRRMLGQEGVPCLEMATGQAGSLSDIYAFIRSQTRPSHPDTLGISYGDGSYDGGDGEHEINEELAQDILAKSDGLFLWATLIVGQLNTEIGEENRQQVIQQVPSEMNDLYRRIAADIAASRHTSPGNFAIAACALKWTVCASRPLDRDEMGEAIRLDISRTLTDADYLRVPASCKDLLFVDQHSNTLRLIHQTVRRFLVHEPSDMRIDQAVAHARIAEVCLTCLTAKEFAPPLPSRRSHATSSSGSSSRSSGTWAMAPISPGAAAGLSKRTSFGAEASSKFAAYASANFAYHLANSSPTNEVSHLLDKFLRQNVLTWIERVARCGSLAILTEAVQHLRTYLERRTKISSPLGKEVQLIEAWINDLARVVNGFGNSILDAPAAIYSLVPLLSPPASNIHRLFASGRTATSGGPVVGSSAGGVGGAAALRQGPGLLGRPAEEGWEDRISCLVHDASASALACSSHYLAVGLATFVDGAMLGKIMVYSAITLELVTALFHGEYVQNLAFASEEPCLVSSGAKKMTCWDTGSWTARWMHNNNFIMSEYPVMLAFSEGDDRIMAPSWDGTFSSFSPADGTRLDYFPLYDAPETEYHSDAGSAAAFSGDEGSDDGGGGDGGSDYSTGTSLSQGGFRAMPGMPPSVVRLSPAHNLVAVTYRNSPVAIWGVGPSASGAGDDEGENLGVFWRSGTAGSYCTNQVHDMAFNPVADLSLLAIAYDIVGVITCDPLTLEELGTCTAPRDACVLAASPDGRTLVAGANSGDMHIFAFEPVLKPLYRISALGMAAKALVFAPSGLRLYDCRGALCNAWEPAVLMRKDGGLLEDGSSSDAGSHRTMAGSDSGADLSGGTLVGSPVHVLHAKPAAGVGGSGVLEGMFVPEPEEMLMTPATPQVNDPNFARPYSEEEHITCLASDAFSGHHGHGHSHGHGHGHSRGKSLGGEMQNLAFCGRNNGVVSIYDLKSGERLQDLALFQVREAIKHLDWAAESGTLLIAGPCSLNMVVRLTKLSPGGRGVGTGEWTVKRMAEKTIAPPVRQALLKSDGTAFLLSAIGLFEAYRITAPPGGSGGGSRQGGELELIRRYSDEGAYLDDSLYRDNASAAWRRLAPHPTNPDLLLSVSRDAVEVYEWSTLTPLVSHDISSSSVLRSLVSPSDAESPTRQQQEQEKQQQNQQAAAIPLGGNWVARKGLDLAVSHVKPLAGPDAAGGEGSQSTLALFEPSRLVARPDSTGHGGNTAAAAAAATVPVRYVTLRGLKSPIRRIIGLQRSSVLFLDGKGWVCSAELRDKEKSGSGGGSHHHHHHHPNNNHYYTRHFFIPRTWLLGCKENPIRLVSKSTVAVSRGAELLLFHGFLEFELEKIKLTGGAMVKRPGREEQEGDSILFGG